MSKDLPVQSHCELALWVPLLEVGVGSRGGILDQGIAAPFSEDALSSTRGCRDVAPVSAV